MKPQTTRTLAVLRDKGDLGATALELFLEAGTFRAAARVGELRADGYRIDTTIVETDRGAHIARYTLSEESAK